MIIKQRFYGVNETFDQTGVFRDNFCRSIHLLNKTEFIFIAGYHTLRKCDFAYITYFFLIDCFRNGRYGNQTSFQQAVFHIRKPVQLDIDLLSDFDLTEPRRRNGYPSDNLRRILRYDRCQAISGGNILIFGPIFCKCDFPCNWSLQYIFVFP